MSDDLRRPLRFCMITTFYPPYNFGGDGIFVQRLSNELARRGHVVEVIHCIDSYALAATPPSDVRADHPAITVHGLKSALGPLGPFVTHQTGFPLLNGKRIRRILSAGFDVIHYHNISLVAGPGVLSMGNAIKLYTMHDFWLVCPTHALFRHNKEPCPEPSGCLTCTLGHRRPPQLWRYSDLLPNALQHVDAFIAPSLTSQRKHEQMGLRGRIEHIPNFVSLTDAADPRSVEPEGRSPRRPYFLYVGRLERLKGLHTIIPTFQRDGAPALWIVGTGTEEASLRAMTRDHDNIRLLGHRSSRELATLYHDAVAVLYPSANFQLGVAPTSVSGGQGAPLVIMEAFSQGTPVIASRMGSVPILLAQTGGGLAYSSEQELQAAMQRLLDDPAQRQEIGRRARDACRRMWTAEAHLGRYFSLIDEIASRRSRER